MFVSVIDKNPKLPVVQISMLMFEPRQLVDGNQPIWALIEFPRPVIGHHVRSPLTRQKLAQVVSDSMPRDTEFATLDKHVPLVTQQVLKVAPEHLIVSVTNQTRKPACSNLIPRRR